METTPSSKNTKKSLKVNEYPIKLNNQNQHYYVHHGNASDPNTADSSIKLFKSIYHLLEFYIVYR